MEESTTDEVKRLRQSLRDLVSLTSLSTAWATRDVDYVFESLAATLLQILDLEFVYLATDAIRGGSRETLRLPERGDEPTAWLEATRKMAAVEHAAGWRQLSIGSPGDRREVCVAVHNLAPEGRQGVFMAGSAGPDFPTERDKTMLGVGLSKVNGYLVHSYTEQELRRRDQDLASFFENSAVGLHIQDQDGIILSANRVELDMLGYHRDEYVGSNIIDFCEDRTEMQRAVARQMRGESIQNFETSMRCKDGTTKRVIINSDTAWEDGFVNTRCFLLDVTDFRFLEEQLIQSQKLEGIGRLAGGIAHDFNNILTALLGHAELAEAALSPGHPAYSSVAHINKAGLRAAELTKHLLAFARKQLIQPKLTDLNQIVWNAETIFSRLLGADIKVKLKLAEDLHPVLVGPPQFEQVLVNLAVNARDAMPKGGILVFSTRNITEAEPGNELRGEFVELTVTDSGEGMDKKTLQRIFEPFFTTKEVGQGTGLGLSTAYGLIKQSGGVISAKSKPGKGTTFRILLPKAKESLAAPDGLQLFSQESCVDSVLVVDSDSDARELAASTLKEDGYLVRVAKSGAEALKVAKEGFQKLDLLIIDLVLPDQEGPQVAAAIVGRHPKVAVLYSSGHHGRTVERGENVLDKPFTQVALSQYVKRLLRARSKR
ncbi:MAG: ATP-binding response regulator [Fimbriimonadales bacterium]